MSALSHHLPCPSRQRTIQPQRAVSRRPDGDLARDSYAIGGIDRDRLPELVRRGIRSYAVVRYVCRRARPFDAIRELLDTAAEAESGLWCHPTGGGV